MAVNISIDVLCPVCASTPVNLLSIDPDFPRAENTDCFLECEVCGHSWIDTFPTEEVYEWLNGVGPDHVVTA